MKINVCQFYPANKSDAVVIALYECELTRKYIRKIVQLVDRINAIDGLLTAEAFIFDVEDPALNIMILLMANVDWQKLTSGTFHNGQISLNVFLNEVCKRIKVDCQNMSRRRFNEK